MSETIRLDVAAELSALPTVRMVLGGFGSRADLGIEQLDDVSLALEEFLRVVIGSERPPRFGIEMRIEDGALHVVTGPFTSPGLREQVQPVAPGAVCLDLCRLLRHTLDEVKVEERDGSYSVVLVKATGGTE